MCIAYNVLMCRKESNLRYEMYWKKYPLHAGIAYLILFNIRASNTVFSWVTGRPWALRSFIRYILWLPTFSTAETWSSKRSLSVRTRPSNFTTLTCSIWGRGLGWRESLGFGRLKTISLVLVILRIILLSDFCQISCKSGWVSVCGG